MLIILDHEKCTGIGICESLSPERFEIDDEGELAILDPEVPEEQRAALEEVVRACPTAALRLTGS